MYANWKSSEGYSAQLKCPKFVSVTVMVKEPTPAEIKKRIQESQKISKVRPKVFAINPKKQKTRPDIPLYSADPKNPDLIIQRLNGKKTRSLFRKVRFVEA